MWSNISRGSNFFQVGGPIANSYGNLYVNFQGVQTPCPPLDPSRFSYFPSRHLGLLDIRLTGLSSKKTSPVKWRVFCVYVPKSHVLDKNLVWYLTFSKTWLNRWPILQKRSLIRPTSVSRVVKISNNYNTPTTNNTQNTPNFSGHVFY